VGEASNASRRVEPWWVKTSYLTAAVVAGFCDWLFVSGAAAPNSDNTNPAWTVYLGTCLALASAVALIAALARARLARLLCRAAATGAAASFVLLGAASIGIVFAPLVAWLCVSTFANGRSSENSLSVSVTAFAVAFLIPLVGLMTVYQR